MSGDFGLEDICKYYRFVMFDFPGLCAPFNDVKDPKQHAERLTLFCRAFRINRPCKVSQAVLNEVYTYAKGGSKVGEALVGVLVYGVDKIGRRTHHLLRQKCLETCSKQGVTDYDRTAIFCALAHAREGEKTGSPVPTAYMTGSDKNLEAYKSLRAEFKIEAKLATPFMLNSEGVYLPVLDTIKA